MKKGGFKRKGARNEDVDDLSEDRYGLRGRRKRVKNEDLRENIVIGGPSSKNNQSSTNIFENEKSEL